MEERSSQLSGREPLDLHVAPGWPAPAGMSENSGFVSPRAGVCCLGSAGREEVLGNLCDSASDVAQQKYPQQSRVLQLRDFFPSCRRRNGLKSCDLQLILDGLPCYSPSLHQLNLVFLSHRTWDTSVLLKIGLVRASLKPGARWIESQNHFGWNRPLGLSSPTPFMFLCNV